MGVTSMVDTRPCPRCAESTGLDDLFCEACGQELAGRRASTTTALPATGADRRCSECGATSPPATEYCDDCGLRLPDPANRTVIDLGVLAGVSDRGLVHHRNEDAVALGSGRDGTLTAVVCDGVSTTVRPERASRTAADTALAVLLAADAPADPAQRLRASVSAAADAVAGLDAKPEGASCTFVAAVIEDGQVTVGWVGDSRAYWLGAAGTSRLLTKDHSWAAEVVAEGLTDEATANADRRAHTITRWLGPDMRSEPDVAALPLTGPGVVLVCSDGLWNYVPEAENLAALVAGFGAGTAPLTVAERLTKVALDAGGQDNISVVVIELNGEKDQA